MRIMNVRTFRTEFTTLTEPVAVINRQSIIGTWSPVSPTEPFTISPPTEMTNAQLISPQVKRAIDDEPRSNWGPGNPDDETENPVVDWSAPYVPKAQVSGRPFGHSRPAPKGGTPKRRQKVVAALVTQE